MTTHAHGMQHDMSAEMQACLEACNACRDACLVTLAHCIEKGGSHAEARHLETLLDCATICATSGAFLARGSERHGRVCGVCASICRDCEASCRAIPDGETMRRCADACRRCAEACEQMAA